MFSIKSKIFTCLTPFASKACRTVTSKIPIHILARSTVKTRDWITVIAIWENQPSDTLATNRTYMYEVFQYTVCRRGLPVARVKNQTPVKPGNQRNKIYKIFFRMSGNHDWYMYFHIMNNYKICNYVFMYNTSYKVRWSLQESTKLVGYMTSAYCISTVIFIRLV